MNNLWEVLERFDVLFGVIGGIILLYSGVQWLRSYNQQRDIQVFPDVYLNKLWFLGLALLFFFVAYWLVSFFQYAVLLINILSIIFSLTCIRFVRKHEMKIAYFYAGLIVVFSFSTIIIQPWCVQEQVRFVVSRTDTQQPLPVISNRVEISQSPLLLRVEAIPESRLNRSSGLPKLSCEWFFQGDSNNRKSTGCTLLIETGTDEYPDLISVKATQFNCSQGVVETLWVYLVNN